MTVSRTNSSTTVSRTNRSGNGKIANVENAEHAVAGEQRFGGRC